MSKQFDASSRSPVFTLTSASSYLTLPTSRKPSLILSQPFLVVQVALSPSSSSPFSLTLHVVDRQSVPCQLRLSTSTSAVSLHPFHAELPLELERGEWVVLIIPVADVLYDVMHTHYAGVERLVLQGACKLRRVFTVPALEDEDDDEQRTSDRRPLRMERIPAEHAFDSDTFHFTRLFTLPGSALSARAPPHSTAHRYQREKPAHTAIDRHEVRSAHSDSTHRSHQSPRRAKGEARKSHRAGHAHRGASERDKEDRVEGITQDETEKRASIHGPLGGAAFRMVPYDDALTAPSRDEEREDEREERRSSRRTAEKAATARRAHGRPDEAFASRGHHARSTAQRSQHVPSAQAPPSSYAAAQSTLSSSIGPSVAKVRAPPPLQRQHSAPEAVDVQRNRVGQEREEPNHRVFHDYGREERPREHRTRRAPPREQVHHGGAYVYRADLSSAEPTPMSSVSSSALSSRRPSATSSALPSKSVSGLSSAGLSLSSTPAVSQPSSPSLQSTFLHSGSSRHQSGQGSSRRTSAITSARDSLSWEQEEDLAVQEAEEEDLEDEQDEVDDDGDEKTREREPAAHVADRRPSLTAPSQATSSRLNQPPQRPPLEPTATNSALTSATPSQFDDHHALDRPSMRSLFSSPSAAVPWPSMDPLPAAQPNALPPSLPPFSFLPLLGLSSPSAPTASSAASLSAAAPAPSGQSTGLPLTASSFRAESVERRPTADRVHTTAREDAVRPTERAPLRPQQQETIEEIEEEEHLRDLSSDEDDDHESAVNSPPAIAAELPLEEEEELLGSEAPSTATSSASSQSASRSRAAAASDRLRELSNSDSTSKAPLPAAAAHRAVASTDTAFSSGSTTASTPRSLVTVRSSALVPMSSPSSPVPQSSTPVSSAGPPSPPEELVLPLPRSPSSRPHSRASGRNGGGELLVRWDPILRAFFEPATGTWYELREGAMD